MIAPGLLGWLIEALIASTLLMVLVLAIRAPVRRAFGPDVAYALWALPLLRMLLPPLPASWGRAAAAPIAAASQTITIYVVEPLGGGASTATGGDSLAMLGPIVAGLWVLGAAAFLLWHATAHMRFCNRMLAQQIRASEIDGGIHLIETEAANGPLAFGVLRKYVAFPRDFVERYDQDERDLALAHELGHHARGDLIANWAALGMLALHWFNPVAWRAFRAFRADQEIANDARVLAGLSAIARHTYACAIVKSAHGGAVSAACHLHTINDLKGRLKMLTTSRTSRSRLIGGAAAVAVLTLTGLGLTASGTQAAETVRTRVEQATGVNLAQFQVTPPAPPAEPAPVGAMAAVQAPIAPTAPTAQPAPVTTPSAPQWAASPVPPVLPVPAVEPGTVSRDVSTVTTNENGRIVKRIKVVSRDGNGKVQTESWQGMDALRNMPEVTSANCPGGNANEMVLNEQKGGKRRIVICANRIERAASAGTAMAANSKSVQRNALQTAIASLRATRASLASNRDMPAEDRADALKDIDDAIREVANEMASQD